MVASHLPSRPPQTSSGPPHEDTHLFLVWMPGMLQAVDAINKIGCAHLLRQIVPDTRVSDGRVWLIFKDDSWLKTKWQEHFTPEQHR